MTAVRIYWNLNKHCVSVQCAKTKRVIGYARRVLLRDVAFQVSEAGRQYVIAKGQRQIHAYACGDLVAVDWIENKSGLPVSWGAADTAAAAVHVRRVAYNPFRDATFTADGRPIHAAPSLYLTGDTKAACYV